MKRSIIALALLSWLTACTEAPAPSTPTVTIDGEKLNGERLNNGDYVFRGVPFAEPPVGELRWRPPLPLESRVPERDATAFAPACMQAPRILEWYRDLAETFGATRDVFDDLDVSEDCLYLNVWTPTLDPSANLPVMVYVHGGSNNSGWSYEPNYHGHALAERGVVSISIAYRLGVFGFFSHPGMNDANFGLWDQVAALEWIRDYVSSFGGDPDRVMIFGESAGAQDILALMSSTRAAGLFHAAALQSTAGFGIGADDSPTLEDERARGSATARLFGFSGADELGQLRDVPASELLERYESEFADYYHSPAVDGNLLERPVWDTVVTGDLLSVPFIIGSNADEWYDSVPEDATLQDVADAIESSSLLNSVAVVDSLGAESDPREALDRLSAAAGMLCPSQALAERQTGLHGNGWAYYFSRVRDGEAGRRVRAYHGAELPYVFGTHEPWMTTADTDWRLSDSVMAYWINLASNGDPNGEGLPDWPAFTGPSGRVIEFGNEVSVGEPQEAVLCGVFRESVAIGD